MPCQSSNVNMHACSAEPVAERARLTILPCLFVADIFAAGMLQSSTFRLSKIWFVCMQTKLIQLRQSRSLRALCGGFSESRAVVDHWRRRVGLGNSTRGEGASSIAAISHSSSTIYKDHRHRA